MVRWLHKTLKLPLTRYILDHAMLFTPNTKTVRWLLKTMDRNDCDAAQRTFFYHRIECFAFSLSNAMAFEASLPVNTATLLRFWSDVSSSYQLPYRYIRHRYVQWLWRRWTKQCTSVEKRAWLKKLTAPQLDKRWFSGRSIRWMQRRIADNRDK